jgi:hypothetical protein
VESPRRRSNSKVHRNPYKFLGVVAVSVFAVLGYLSYRNSVMERLYAEAAGYPKFFRRSKESANAVNELASYHGRRSTELLINIAINRGPFVSSDAQAAAIDALSKRKDPDIAVMLAGLLQPHQGLDVRREAATALKKLPCNSLCVRAILHYLERTSQGQLNSEDLVVRPAGFDDVSISLEKDQTVVYNDLYAVLRREKAETLINLSQVYGLGSDDPSLFALDLSTKLGIHEACPVLKESDHAIMELSEPNKAPREAVQTALSSLQCDRAPAAP